MSDYEMLLTEQNRTEQNRTEQNRTEQNRTEQNRTEQNRTEQNTDCTLFLTVHKLKLIKASINMYMDMLYVFIGVFYV